ncbi:MAG TPA: hypothetical protein VJ571_06060 [Candidatus Nitrosotalea sp.]|nr:hypothetical protein [Candidatus Nitrosotalea sp.]
MLNKLMIDSSNKINLEIQKKFKEIILLIEKAELIDSKLSTNNAENILNNLAFQLNDVIDRTELK